MRFQWDENKDRSNEKKHGIGFAEASTVFADPFSQTIFDPDHSETEERFLTVGLSHRGKLLVVWHTDRNLEVRIIGSRSADNHETKRYLDGRT